MPVFSAMGRILLMNPKGSEKSSQLGSKTGHSGGGTNSANTDMSTVRVSHLEGGFRKVVTVHDYFQHFCSGEASSLSIMIVPI